MFPLPFIFVVVVSFLKIMLCLELCRCPSDIFLYGRSRTVPHCQPRSKLLSMVEDRLVNVMKIHITHIFVISIIDPSISLGRINGRSDIE